MTNISEDLLIQSLDDNGILRLTLNDPNNKNALSELMIKKLIDSLTNIRVT